MEHSIKIEAPINTIVCTTLNQLKAAVHAANEVNYYAHDHIDEEQVERMWDTMSNGFYHAVFRFYTTHTSVAYEFAMMP